MHKLRLAAYGNTLYMTAIAASLGADPAMTVVLVDPDAPGARHSIDEFGPDVIAFELGAPSLDLPVSLLRERPGLLLAAIDNESGDTLVLAARRAQHATTGDLVNLFAEAIAQPLAA